MGLSLQNVDMIVGRQTHRKDVSLDFKARSRNVLLGRTPAGKTSPLRMMAGIDRPSRGKIKIDGNGVVLEAGRVLQTGTPPDVYPNPANTNLTNR